jgi:hypothetical protein
MPAGTANETNEMTVPLKHDEVFSTSMFGSPAQMRDDAIFG